MYFLKELNVLALRVCLRIWLYFLNATKFARPKGLPKDLVAFLNATQCASPKGLPKDLVVRFERNSKW